MVPFSYYGACLQATRETVSARIHGALLSRERKVWYEGRDRQRQRLFIWIEGGGEAARSLRGPEVWCPVEERFDDLAPEVRHLDKHEEWIEERVRALTNMPVNILVQNVGTP